MLFAQIYAIDTCVTLVAPPTWDLVKGVFSPEPSSTSASLRPWPDDRTLSGRLVCFHTKSVNKQNLVAKRSPDTGLRTQWSDSQFHGKM